MKRIIPFVLVLCAAVCATAQVPAANHVFVIVEENQSYSSVIGNSSLPYFNSLAQKYGLATNFYGNTHPSIGNYFMMTTGQIYTNDDNYLGPLPSSVDNIVRRAMTGGKTWKSYAEGLPYAGYLGGNTGGAGDYYKRHNPFAYFSDVANSSAEKMNLVSTSQLLTDLANDQVPNLAFIVPNGLDDAHDGTPQQMDKWLSQYVPKILASRAFQDNGILIITFDESFSSDTAHGGGHIPTLVISPKGKTAYKSTTFYQQQSLLKTTLLALGLNPNLGAAASAPDMGEFFTSSSAPSTPPSAAGVTVTAPLNGATVTSPAQFMASANGGSYPITAMRVYVDNNSAYTVNAASLNTSLALPAGAHYVVVQAWNSAGQAFTKSLNITVSAGTPAPTSPGVTVTAPLNGATVTSPAQFVASANGGGYPITAMRIYVDSNSAYTVSAAGLNTSLALPAGAHSVVVQAWNSAGQVFTRPLNITVSAGTPAPASPGVTITSPIKGASVGSPVQIAASATATSGRVITAMRVYLDYQSAYTVNGSKVTTALAMSAGAHNITINAWDNTGAVYQSAVNISVP